MLSVTPGGTVADEARVYALIALIADPEEARKRLEELSAAAASANAAQKGAIERLTEAQTAEKVASDRLHDAEEREREVTQQAGMVASDRQKLVEKQRTVELAESAFELKKQDAIDHFNGEQRALEQRERTFKASVAAAEQAMLSREKAVAAREQDAKDREAAVAKRDADVQARLNQMKQLAG